MIGFRKGRLGTGYTVLTLWNWLFDFHIIRIPITVDVPWHTDQVIGKQHHRVNFHINDQGRTRYMDVDKSLKSWFSGRLVYFRPDLRMHMVKKDGSVLGLKKLNKRSLIIISIGWSKKKK